ncbi:MAG: GNAT family N-acetyltransferase, partial [Mucilaginibacter sp.]
MEHVLDNPAWNALISGNKHLAHGREQVRYFDREVSPFVGLEENSPRNFSVLHEQVPHNNPILFVAPNETEFPAQWKVLQFIKGLQMVCYIEKEQDLVQRQMVPLTDEHIPQMLALTKLTNPGPFAAKTIEFGHYQGVFEQDKLVAMAGQRLHVFEYAEVSAVCTHPDHLGKGYARELLLRQMHRIKAASGVPFLHVRYDNERAISLYER